MSRVGLKGYRWSGGQPHGALEVKGRPQRGIGGQGGSPKGAGGQGSASKGYRWSRGQPQGGRMSRVGLKGVQQVVRGSAPRGQDVKGRHQRGICGQGTVSPKGAGAMSRVGIKGV